MKKINTFKLISRFSFIFFIALMPALMLAQSSVDDKTEIKPEKGKKVDRETGLRTRTELRLADRLYAEKSYFTAISYYREALRQDRDNRYGIFWLAQSYRMARDYANAEVWFKKFVDFKVDDEKKQAKIDKEAKDYYPMARFYYGLVLKNNGKYEEAKKQFGMFLKDYDRSDKDHYKRVVKNELEGCDFAIQAVDRPSKIKVKPLKGEVNRNFNEQAPIPMGDSVLYYASLASDTIIYYERKKDVLGARLFKSVSSENGWSKGTPVSEVINEDGYTIGSGSFTPDGSRFYFTKCLGFLENSIVCQLYVSEYSEGRWGTPLALNEEINDENYTNTHPTVRQMEDGSEMVYFSSDREGGKGGMDLWYFTRTKSGDYKGPKLVKGGLNTVEDEITPFYDNSDNMLYFSSDGHPGIGGFDIFRTSESADLAWVTPQNMGVPVNSGADDTYYIRYPGTTSGYLVSNREGAMALASATCCDDIWQYETYNYGLQGFVYKEGEGGEPLGDAKIKVYTTDRHGNEFLVKVDSTSASDPMYFVKLEPESDYRVEIIRNGFRTSEQVISTKGLDQEDTLSNDFFIAKAEYVISGNLYEENDSMMKAPMTDAIVTLTDMDGKVISLKRMKGDNPEYDFKLAAGRKYKVNVKKDGYFNKTIEINTDKLADIDTVSKDIFLSKMRKDRAYTLQNVLYEFGKSDLTPSSESVMDTLYALLKENPSVIIELSAHTDDVGSEAANAKLSQARAESCVKYLLAKGIKSERLFAKGYGESMPKVPNRNADGSDNPENRATNRRTEFKVIGELDSKVKYIDVGGE